MASDAVVNLVVNAADAETDIQVQLNHIVNQAERNAPPITLHVNIDQRQITNNINQVNDGLNSVRRNADDADGSTNRLGSAFGAMGRAALTAVTSAGRLGLIASLASAALPAVVGLAGALANLAPAATAGVAAFLTLKLAAGTLKVGLIGVSDAISQVFSADADPEALAKALERLAPEARAFVLELRSMKPALEDLRLETQDRLFNGLDVQLERLGKQVLPQARTAAFSFADSLNNMATGAAIGATNLSEQGVLGAALKSSAGAFRNLERVPGQVLVSIIRLATAGGPLLNRITSRIADAATSVSKSLATAQQSGALKSAVDGAVSALKQIGRVAANVFGALGNIFSTASAAGGGLFGSLEKITQALEDLTATKGFKETLTALIETGQTLLSTILPLLTQAFQAISPVIAILAPPIQTIIALLGAQLGPIITLLGPILEQVATAFGNLLIALSPLIEAAGTLIVAILPVLTPLFDALNQIIVALTPVIDVLVTSLVDALLPVIEALIPVITLLAEFIARVVVALAPLVEELVPLAVDIFTRWFPVITLVLEAITPLIAIILDLVASLIEHLVPAIQQGIQWIKDYAEEFKRVAGETFRRIVIPALEAIIALLNGDFSKAWEGAKTVAVRAGAQIAGNMLNLSVQIRTQVLRAMSFALSEFERGFHGMVRAAAQGVADVLGRIASLPGQILRIFGGSLSSALFGAGQAVISAFARGMLSQLGSVASAAADIVGRVKDFFPNSPAKRGPLSGRGYTLYSGRALVDSFAQGIQDRSGSLASVLNSTLSLSALATSPAGSAQNANALGLMAGNVFGRVAAPAVSVYIGNELLDDRMRTVVTQENGNRDRQASQGVRF